ncbi:hypothetical protein CgunFtcFv8_018738 [Champsocephalus gunnari]|uniref:Secreted protein n=1 Tax=Champsocephalus gunnari TaxID=52237 RepID=A0AAN8BUS2_CHAGU|nr:hypothetical protein CgunFtcFv8_018738 [Champsocephalus gunnari]
MVMMMMMVMVQSWLDWVKWVRSESTRCTGSGPVTVLTSSRITPQLTESRDPHLPRFCSNMKTYTRYVSDCQAGVSHRRGEVFETSPTAADDVIVNSHYLH